MLPSCSATSGLQLAEKVYNGYTKHRERIAQVETLLDALRARQWFTDQEIEALWGEALRVCDMAPDEEMGDLLEALVYAFE